jgi:hypothetical protein
MSSVKQEKVVLQNKECSVDYLADAMLKLDVTNDNMMICLNLNAC